MTQRHVPTVTSRPTLTREHLHKCTPCAHSHFQSKAAAAQTHPTHTYTQAHATHVPSATYIQTLEPLADTHPRARTAQPLSQRYLHVAARQHGGTHSHRRAPIWLLPHDSRLRPQLSCTFLGTCPGWSDSPELPAWPGQCEVAACFSVDATRRDTKSSEPVWMLPGGGYQRASASCPHACHLPGPAARAAHKRR